MVSNEEGIEIKDLPKKRDYIANYIILFSIVGILGTVFIYSLVVTEEYIWVILVIIIMATSSCLGSWFIYSSRFKYQIPTSFFISDKLIRVLVPRKSKFEIIWPEFDSFKFRVVGIPTLITSIANFVAIFGGSGVDMSLRQLEIKFFKGEPKVVIKKVKVRLFNDNEIRKILYLLVDFAKKMQKEPIIEKHTKEFYQLEL